MKKIFKHIVSEDKISVRFLSERRDLVLIVLIAISPVGLFVIESFSHSKFWKNHDFLNRKHLVDEKQLIIDKIQNACPDKNTLSYIFYFILQIFI